MIRAFKRSRIASAALMLLSVFIAVIIWFRDTGHPFFVPLIGPVLMLGIGYFSSRVLGNLLSSMENTRYLGYLHMELDPNKFIEHYRDIPGRLKEDSQSAAVMRSYLADGYAADGDFGTALATLASGPDPKELSVRGLYATNRCAYYLGLEDTEHAREAIAELSQIIDACRLNKADLAKNLTESMRLYQQNLNCLTGDAVDTDFLDAAFQRAQYNIRRLEISKVLAMAALRDGRSAEAKKHLGYLRKNSEKTYFKRWADQH